MRTTNNTTRLATMTALAAVAVVALVAMPAEGSSLIAFFSLLLASKGVALLCIWAAHKIATGANVEGKDKEKTNQY